MSTYTPDKWLVVKISIENDTIDKVCANWYGGYLNGDSWKLSSGITETVEFEDRFEYTNHSGSLYICYKGREGMNSYGASVLHGLTEDVTTAGGTLEILTKNE